MSPGGEDGMALWAGRVEELARQAEERLFYTRFVVDEKPHIRILSPDTCRACPEKWCNFFCPASVYRFDPEEKVNRVLWEGCLECGTCRVGCPYRNIEWHPPRGGFGVQYKYG
jgi:ferredoxin like protein